MLSASFLLQDAHFGLRYPDRSDHDEYLNLRRLSKALHVPWEPLPEPESEASSPASFARFLAASRKESSEKYLICRVRDGVICGYVGLSQIFYGPFCSAYIGYWTGRPFLRHGVATRGVTLCLEHAFTALGLHRVEANIIPSNEGSIAVARRCGFSLEGYSPRYLKIAGQWQDHQRWAITLEDWQKLS